METSVITALAAAGGSLVGASASVMTTWITQRTQSDRELTQSKLRERETLYGEFITEASRLAVDAASHTLENPEKLVILYGIIGRIRLVSSDEVLAESEKCGRRIFELYGNPNFSVDELRASFDFDRLDPLKSFSCACRAELIKIGTNGRR
jgi:hypothetical protein